MRIKRRKKKVQRVHFNKINHLNNKNKNHHQEDTNIVFESESSCEEEDILNKTNTKT